MEEEQMKICYILRDVINKIVLHFEFLVEDDHSFVFFLRLISWSCPVIQFALQTVCRRSCDFLVSQSREEIKQNVLESTKIVKIYSNRLLASYTINFSELAGDIHFDDDEKFTHNSPDGVNLGWTALHEIGHSLGLEHSHTYGAIMSPYYTEFYHPDIGLALSTDDIRGIQALYGKLLIDHVLHDWHLLTENNIKH